MNKVYLNVFSTFKTNQFYYHYKRENLISMYCIKILVLLDVDKSKEIDCLIVFGFITILKYPIIYILCRRHDIFMNRESQRDKLTRLTG